MLMTMTTNTQEYLVSFFYFYLTSSFLDDLLVLRHTAPLFQRQWGNKSHSRENTQEMLYDVSWAFSKLFFSLFLLFLYYLLIFFR